MGERTIFEILISVSSIGPSKAINILSQISPAHFIRAIRQEEIATIASLKGIGTKTAERMVLDLKGKIAGIAVDQEDIGIEGRKIEDAKSGLISLGFKDSAAREMRHAIKDEIDNDDKAEDLIRKALKRNA